jgi:hypothetical protein
MMSSVDWVDARCFSGTKKMKYTKLP